MFPQLNICLDLDEKDLPSSGTHISICDTERQLVPRPQGSFIQLHFLSLYLRQGHPCCFYSTSENYANAKIISAKCGFALQSYLTSGALKYVSGPQICHDFCPEISIPGERPSDTTCPAPSSPDALRKTFDTLAANVVGFREEFPKKAPCLFLEDLSMFLDLGHSAHDLMKFLRSLHSLVSNGVLVTYSTFCDDTEAEGPLAAFLFHSADWQLDTIGLKSGLSSAVDGELQGKFRPDENMKLTFTNTHGEFTSLDLADDMEVENVKALCEMDLGMAADTMVLSLNGNDLTDSKKTLVASGLKDGDVVLVKKNGGGGSRPLSGPSHASGGNPSKIPKIDFGSIVVPGSSRGSKAPASTADAAQGNSRFTATELLKARMIAEGIKRGLTENRSEIERQMETFPGLLDAAMKDDYVAVATIIGREEQEVRRKQQMLINNPDSEEAQKLIHEQIRLERIQENFEYALEHAPESLAHVHMLYVNSSVNGVKMEAFVDSGAQISIISRDVAQQCHIAHLIDDRFQGMAVGVGSQRFVGKIHACQMEIGGAFLTTSFSVLEDNHMQILLGLDMLKRHQMVIDLKRNVLVIGTTGAETAFLSEAEIPNSGVGRADGTQFAPNESDIQLLIGMGFSRAAAREALTKYDGNKDAAVAELLQKQQGGKSGASGSR